MTTTASSTKNNNWTSQFQIKQLEDLLHYKQIPQQDGVCERIHLEGLVQKHVGTLEAAQAILAQQKGAVPNNVQPSSVSSTTTTADNDDDQQDDFGKKLRKMLKEDRSVMNYTDYTPSAQHVARIKEFAKLEPSVFDNPDVTPRNAWFRHPVFSRTQQMPPYHIHFRQEMQQAARCLDEAYRAVPFSEAQWRATIKAQRYVQACVSGLHGHVSIEEYNIFPVLQHKHPRIDLDFLFRDHQRLDQEERELTRALDELITTMTTLKQKDGSSVSSDDISKVLQLLLAFDASLMTHLGEEEEVVVPISLIAGGM